MTGQVSGFWKLIDESRSAASEGGADGSMARQTNALLQLLLSLTPAEVVEFQEILLGFHRDAYRWGLWGAAHVIAGGCSDDNFMDFRNWLISRGRETYERALADAESLVEAAADPSVEDVFFEGLLSIPAEAYSRLTGKSIPEPSSIHPTSPLGSKWKDEEQLAAHYPKLWARFRTNPT